MVLLAILGWLASAHAEPLGAALEGSRALHGPCPQTTSWRPVGFSPQGAFASVAWVESDAMSQWILTVQSLVDDKVLVRVSWPGGDELHPPLSAFLERSGVEIAEALTEHGIQPARFADGPSAFPLQHEGDTLTATVRPGLSNTELGPVRHQFLTELTSAQDGKKRIDERWAIDESLLGAFVSPFEPRAAVVLGVQTPGFEGTVDCRIQVVGAHLETGFR